VDIVVEDAFPEVAWQEDEEEDGDDGEEVTRTGRRAGRKSRVGDVLGRAEDDEDKDEDEETQPRGWRPHVRLTFHGPHVFAGIRQLVEAGIIDGERMPGWMTGEEGVTIGAVRNGRIRGHKGSGI
jgi:central kinetochore subunit Mis15/CHL4